MITRQQTNPEEDFQHIVKNLFSVDSQEEDKPTILVSFYFSLPDCNDLTFENNPVNISFCPGADLDLDYDLSIKKVGMHSCEVKISIIKYPLVINQRNNKIP